MVRWNYPRAATDRRRSTTARPTRSRPTSATRRRARRPVEPTFDGLDTIAKPEPATIWKKYPNAGNAGVAERAGLRQPHRRRHAADGGPDLPLRREHGRLGRLPGVLRRLVVHQQPRLQRRLLEGSPDAPGQQRDAARAGLAAVQPRRYRRDAAEQPGHRHAVRRRRRALHGPLPRRLLPQQHQRVHARADRQGLLRGLRGVDGADHDGRARPGDAGRGPDVRRSGHRELHGAGHRRQRARSSRASTTSSSA